MHKIIKLTLLILFAFVLVSCDSQGAEKDDKKDENIPTETSDGFVLTATVTDVSDGRLMVDVTAGEYAEGIYSVIVAEDAAVVDKNGNFITIEKIHTGDTVKITYNGQTMMSYPPQIVARKIILE